MRIVSQSRSIKQSNIKIVIKCIVWPSCYDGPERSKMVNESKSTKETLRTIAYERAYIIYGKVLTNGVEKRIEYELDLIEKEKASELFLDCYELMKEVVAEDVKFDKGFRRNLGNWFVAYLLGLTTMNAYSLGRINTEFGGSPVQLYLELYSEQNITVDIDLGKRIYFDSRERIENLNQKHENLHINCNTNLTLLDELGRETEDYYACTVNNGERTIHRDPANLYDFFTKSDSLLQYLPDLGSDIVRDIIFSMCKYTPYKISDMAKIIGLAHGSGTWIGVQSNSIFLSSPEDLYECFRFRLNGKGEFDEEQLRLWAWMISKGQAQTLYNRDNGFVKLLEGSELRDTLCNIQYMFSRSQCLQRAIETKRLIYYLVNYQKIYKKVYERVML